MSNAIDALSAILDVETHPAEFEDARVVLGSAGQDCRQGDPSAASINQQAKDSRALSFGVRRIRNLLYRIAICFIFSNCI